MVGKELSRFQQVDHCRGSVSLQPFHFENAAVQPIERAKLPLPKQNFTFVQNHVVHLIDNFLVIIITADCGSHRVVWEQKRFLAPILPAGGFQHEKHNPYDTV